MDEKSDMSPDEVAGALVGDVWSYILSDRRSGEMIELGSLRQRDRPLSNSALSDIERNFEGEHSLFIQTKWELDSPIPLEMPAERRAFDSAGVLHALVGQTIDTANIDAGSLALTLKLSEGATLTVDPSNMSDDYAAYTVRLGRSYWTAYRGGRWTSERVRGS